MFKATVKDYNGNTLLLMSINAETFEDAEGRAVRYANEYVAEWDCLAVDKA